MNDYSVGKYYKGKRGLDFSKGRQDKLDHFGYQLQKKLFIPFLKSNENVLDFGCGNGSLARCLAQDDMLVEGLEVNEYPRNFAIKSG